MKPSLGLVAWMSTFSVLCLTVLSSVFATGRCMLQTSGEEEYSADVSKEVPTSEGSKVFRDNGMLYLVLHELSREFIRDLLEVEQIPLNENQQQVVGDRIKGFYRQILDHPALSNDRVIYAPKQPDFQHLVPSNSIELSYPSERNEKRSGALEMEVCPSQSSWVQFLTGSTRDDRRLTLYGDQYFWVTECAHDRGTCRHISAGYRSRCVQKTSWVMAYLIDPQSENGRKWDWISVPSCCTCALSRASR